MPTPVGGLTPPPERAGGAAPDDVQDSVVDWLVRQGCAPPDSAPKALAVAARILWLNEPGAEGPRAARFLLAHVPVTCSAVRRVNRSCHLRILRPLLDPRYVHHRGDTFEALDWRPMARPGREAAPTVGRPDERDVRARWRAALRRIARSAAVGNGGGPPRRSLLGLPLPV